MEILKFDLTRTGGEFKPMNAVNGGPWHKRHANDQKRSNFEDYKAARIPYSRNHDSAVCNIYGGPYSIDITNIFPNFGADPEKPESYDFPCTDESILVPLEAGCKTFFRLGQTIEHQVKKHGTIPPADFKKWAVICEHIIRHYNEGWADGFNLGIEYWEIWNEADLDDDDSTNKRTWGGTKKEFFDFYETASKHLKGCFPNLKIGGPALAGDETHAEEFISEMKKRKVELDFLSWHIYCVEPNLMIERAEKIKNLLLENGYDKTESILNEWNYVRGWEDDFLYSIKTIISMKGAAFAMACMSAAQKSSIDMLMYYDARPSCFNGLFDFYTYEPLKSYYPFKWYGMFYDMKAEIICENEPENIYTTCGVSESGKVMLILTYYSDKENLEDRELFIDFGKESEYEIYLLDSEHDAELCEIKRKLNLTIRQNTSVLIKEK